MDEPSTSTSRKRHLSECIENYSKYFDTKSPIFESDNIFALQCLNCQKKIKANNRSGSNLRTHYQNKHLALYATMCIELSIPSLLIFTTDPFHFHHICFKIMIVYIFIPAAYQVKCFKSCL